MMANLRFQCLLQASRMPARFPDLKVMPLNSSLHTNVDDVVGAAFTTLFMLYVVIPIVEITIAADKTIPLTFLNKYFLTNFPPFIIDKGSINPFFYGISN